jgi:hypothetical protein
MAGQGNEGGGRAGPEEVVEQIALVVRAPPPIIRDSTKRATRRPAALEELLEDDGES